MTEPRLANGEQQLTVEERTIADALGATGVPSPRLTDDAFARRVADQRAERGGAFRRARWLALGPALAAAGALLVLVIPGGPTPDEGDDRSALAAPPSGRELLALSRDALALDEQEGGLVFDDETLIAAAALTPDEWLEADLEADEETPDDDVALELLALGEDPLDGTGGDAWQLDELDDDDLALLGAYLDRELPL